MTEVVSLLGGVWDIRPVAVAPVSAWAARADMLLDVSWHAGCGTSDAALSFGGSDSMEYNNTHQRSETERYDGNTWSQDAPLTMKRYGCAGCGTSTAALNFGGVIKAPVGNGNYDTKFTEQYDGASWSTVADMLVDRKNLGGCGTVDSALNIGGDRGTKGKNNVEHYDGTTWSAREVLPISVKEHSSCGASTAALSFGGRDQDLSALTSETCYYNGTTWSAGGKMMAAKKQMGASGTSTSALSFGGEDRYGRKPNRTEYYDGVAWTDNNSDIITSRISLVGCGTSMSALNFGGFSSYAANAIGNKTEEYVGVS